MDDPRDPRITPTGIGARILAFMGAWALVGGLLIVAFVAFLVWIFP